MTQKPRPNRRSDQELVLVGGAPGSGKSTLARAMHGYVHVETDMFFVNRDGEYNYYPRLKKAAHEWCQLRTASLLSEGRSVVVSNTFTRNWERRPYLELAKQYKINVRFIHATGEYPNTHGVPDDVVHSMRQRFEPF